MRLVATADLHYNHPRSGRLARDLIDQINALSNYDALLVIGDTATADGRLLEECLSRFTFSGPRLFLAGNHELWTHRDDSYAIFRAELPARIQALGWHNLQSAPFHFGSLAIVGSLGWYDYSFASDSLAIPSRFYQAKIAPGSAACFPEFAPLLARTDDISPAALQLHARWNDGRFVKLHRADAAFLDELLGELQAQLDSLTHIPTLIAAVHHLPFAQLLPPPASAQWEFAKAYLGSPRIGQLLLRYPNITHLLCGHSHFAAEAQIGPIHAINIGSGYRSKTYRILDLPQPQSHSAST